MKINKIEYIWENILHPNGKLGRGEFNISYLVFQKLNNFI